MNAEIQARWAAALRSGEYTQGQRGLRVGDEHCCLGVLCDLYAKDHPGAEWKREYGFDGKDYFSAPGNWGSTTYPPIPVLRWAGLPEMEWAVFVPDPRTPGKRANLANLNDEGVTFAEIADIVEKL